MQTIIIDEGEQLINQCHSIKYFIYADSYVKDIIDEFLILVFISIGIDQSYSTRVQYDERFLTMF
jgi:hypothetical protein